MCVFEVHIRWRKGKRDFNPVIKKFMIGFTLVTSLDTVLILIFCFPVPDLRIYIHTL